MKTINIHNVHAYARKLMDKYGLFSWTFKLDRAKKRAGLCRFRPQIISLSHYFVTLNEDDEIIDVILHEIAHVIAGPNENHGFRWKHACGLVGAKVRRCALNAIMPNGKYTAYCLNCNKKHYRHRMPKLLPEEYMHCIACGSEKGKLTFSLEN